MATNGWQPSARSLSRGGCNAVDRRSWQPLVSNSTTNDFEPERANVALALPTANCGTLNLPPTPVTFVDRRSDFLRIFNLKTIAAMFYLSFFVGVWSFLPMGIGDTAEQTFFFVGYMTRQTLVSAVSVLLAMALAEAFLARGLPRAARTALVIAGIAAGAFTSTFGRIALARVATMSPTEHASWVLFVGLIWTAIGAVAYLILSSLRDDDATRTALADARCEEERLSTQVIEAHLSALQAQIEPHFLFNTLANVRRLYEIDRQRGRLMLHHLVDYLRSALPSMRLASSTLARELDLARAYLTIQQLRMGERLSFAIDSEHADPAAMIPPMVLPTLVENAIKHGLAPLPRGGALAIRARTEGSDLVVDVADNGRGFVAASGSGVGLANTRARLAALYGTSASLNLHANQPQGVVAQVRVPLRFAPAAA